MDDGSILDEVFEIANLGERQTGIAGVVYISSRRGVYGPRVKYFQRAGGNQPSFSVSIEDDPRLLISSLPGRVTSEMSPKVIAWVRLNTAALLTFWRECDTWLKEDVDAHIDGLKKLEP
jgi:hypothetical protein